MGHIDKSQTNPGFHKLFKVGHFAEDEQRILKKLSSQWYLTNSGAEVELGASSTFRYFLMKPTAVFGEMFNLHREIICVFSPYDNFEPRTLDVFDSAIHQFQQLRLETACRVLICRDEKTEEKIADILKNDPERPIVVPFTYNELLSYRDDFFLRNRFRSHFYTRDLFSFLSPLKTDLYFFGRSELIQDIVGRHESNENSGLFGLRKSGKTSIVFGVERLLRTKGSTHVTIDCENPSFHMLRWNELLHRIVELLRGAKQSSYKISPIEEYTEKEAGRRFEEDVLGIYNSKKKQATLLIFDEIERISPNTGSSAHWREGDDFVYFWQTMRYFFQRYSEVISYLLVGTNPACVEQPKIGVHDNPLFSSIPFQYVPPFDVQKTRDMVRKLGRYMGLKFEEGIYTLLTYDFGGHPFLMRQMCSAINSLCTGPRPTPIDRILYDRAKERFIRDSMHYLEMIVEVLRKDYPDEYQMLSFLSDGDMDTFEYYATDAPYLITHLIGYGLIQASPAGYGFNIECIRDYIQSKNRYSNARLTEEQKIAEISERRNSLEKKLRQLIRNQIKAAYGRKKASDVILGSLPENRRNDLKNRDIDFLLHRDSSPLFFLDLKNILSREWSIFENIFEMDKEKLRIMLDDINQGRVDAHSKLIEDDLFVQLRLHFKKLEGILDEWI